ncbi:MAG: hypothetical protein ABI837_21700, partial [Acidobacteriota bacterium]
MNSLMQPRATSAAKSETRADLVLVSFIIAASWVLFSPILTLWWMYDDAFLLHYAIRHHPGQYLFIPSVWQEFPQKLFTPVLPLAYDTDVFLFGVNAHSYYLHHLVELTLLFVLLHLCLRLWFSPAGSAVATFLFMLGAPTMSWASQLMLRHYVESSIAALVATILYVRGIRRGTRTAIVLSALAYFVAI